MPQRPDIACPVCGDRCIYVLEGGSDRFYVHGHIAPGGSPWYFIVGCPSHARMTRPKDKPELCPVCRGSLFLGAWIGPGATLWHPHYLDRIKRGRWRYRACIIGDRTVIRGISFRRRRGSA